MCFCYLQIGFPPKRNMSPERNFAVTKWRKRGLFRRNSFFAYGMDMWQWHAHGHVCTRTCTYMYKHLHAFAHIHVHVCAHIHVHTYTCIYILRNVKLRFVSFRRIFRRNFAETKRNMVLAKQKIIFRRNHIYKRVIKLYLSVPESIGPHLCQLLLI